MVATRSKKGRLLTGLTKNKPSYKETDTTHRHRLKDRKRMAVNVVTHRRRKPLK